MALTPETVRLSSKSPVPKVVAEVNTATLPLVPPLTPLPPVMPKVEVATHCVPEPVVCKTIPKVLVELFTLSYKAPFKRVEPFTTNSWPGVVVPMPTLPVTSRLLMPDYLLSKGPNEPFFAAAESVYEKLKDGEKIFASTKAEVGVLARCA